MKHPSTRYRAGFMLVVPLLWAGMARAPAQVLDKQALLEAQSFWDNRDWDWYKNTIPFFECPDAEINTTYYYRWELITKHLTYGSPESGYSFTEFIDRPFWSGAYGSISCPAGHQFNEARWLRDPRYARDYARYWFRTPGAEPRRYGCWIADGVWAVDLVHPDDVLVRDLLPDLVRNYEGWEQRHFVPEVGLFWQNGHDDGMEFNINSRQTLDILRGANGYRPGFNSYMYADALAIAQIARQSGDPDTGRRFEKKAASLKENVQKLLWDPQRQFFFPMSMREETDKEGNAVKRHTLTYQSGRFAGDAHGREEHGYIPWQFNLPDPGREGAWKFLMDPDYFYADFGPSTVERHDPLFLLQKNCCWWSGQSWPYATAQTLKALANVLQDYRQNVVSRADYLKLLHIFAVSHRKNGVPYLAEALHPDTGSFEGHDAYNHSEHYFHSSFNDLIITGLIGLKPRADDVLDLRPLAPSDWPYFALDDVPYRGHRLAVIWDRDGSRYHRGPGLRVFAEGREIASLNTLGRIQARFPALARAGPISNPAARFNYAVNNDGDAYPRLTASFTAPRTALWQVNDGNAWYHEHPPNRWTTVGSTQASDWLILDFGTSRRVDTVKLYFLDDGTNVVAPRSYALEYWDGAEWRTVPGQRRMPSEPQGHRANVTEFSALDASRLRATFVHATRGRVGLAEFEAWGDGRLPYLPSPPPRGNLAYHRSGEGFPRATASFTDRFGGSPDAALDGRVVYRSTPMNRWTSYGSTNAMDWLQIEFGTPKEFGRVDLHLYDDHGGVQPPASYAIEVWTGDGWQPVRDLTLTPAVPTGSTINSAKFATVRSDRFRILFHHRGRARSGVTEVEVWRE